MREGAKVIYKQIKKILFDITPRIYSLPEVYFIRWVDYEIIIHKWGSNHNFRRT